jgi:hypothetical protein
VVEAPEEEEATVMVVVQAMEVLVMDMVMAEELVKDRRVKFVKRLVIALEDAGSILIVSSS